MLWISSRWSEYPWVGSIGVSCVMVWFGEDSVEGWWRYDSVKDRGSGWRGMGRKLPEEKELEDFVGKNISSLGLNVLSRERSKSDDN